MRSFLIGLAVIAAVVALVVFLGSLEGNVPGSGY